MQRRETYEEEPEGVSIGHRDLVIRAIDELVACQERDAIRDRNGEDDRNEELHRLKLAPGRLVAVRSGRYV